MSDASPSASHPDGSCCWDHTIEDRLRAIAKGLADNDEISNKLPGLGTLLSEYTDPDVPVSCADFHRRLLRVFRDSDHDFAYQDGLETLPPEDKNRMEEFVAQGKSLDDVSHGFDMCMSLGIREHLQYLIGLDFAKVSSAGIQTFRGSADGGQAPAPTQVDGLSGRKHFDWLKDRNTMFQSFLHRLKDLFKGHLAEHNVVVYQDIKFQNWGLDIHYVPRYTCIPNSVASVQRIVKYAKRHNMTVRCAGFRHSWAPMFGEQGQITISLLSLAEATKIPNFTALSKLLPEWLLQRNELQTIEVVSGKPRVQGNVLVRVGASTTNEQLRRWCVTNNKYTYPLNVVMVEITMGGSNAPICHGGGRRHPTLSDLVRKVEYVDCNGKLQVVTDPRHLRAAAGCFGLMGVITHLTMEFEPMTYALMEPKKLPVLRAIPPPADLPESAIPPALRLPDLTPADRASDLARFKDMAANWYYTEWFWFPYADTCWVNCWNNTPNRDNAVDYPSPTQTFLMFLSQFTTHILASSQILNELITALHLDHTAVTLLSSAAMLALPEFNPPLKTHLPNALHFQRGIQNVRVVLNVEVDIAIPPLPNPNPNSNPSQPDGELIPDWEVVQRAWWHAILTCYRHASTSPQRMPLEMRITGGSEMIMAPQRGNTLGTCAIETVTLEAARGVWTPYAEELVGGWLRLKDSDGRGVKVRPHWAKTWRGLRVDLKKGKGGRVWEERMKEEYEGERREFLGVLGKIGRGHGWGLGEMRKRFGNGFLNWFYFDEVQVNEGEEGGIQG